MFPINTRVFNPIVLSKYLKYPLSPLLYQSSVNNFSRVYPFEPSRTTATRMSNLDSLVKQKGYGIKRFFSKGGKSITYPFKLGWFKITHFRKWFLYPLIYILRVVVCVYLLLLLFIFDWFYRDPFWILYVKHIRKNDFQFLLHVHRYLLLYV